MCSKNTDDLSLQKKRGSPDPQPRPDCHCSIILHSPADVAELTTCPQERARVRWFWDRFPRPARQSAVSTVCPGESGFQGYHLLLTLAGVAAGRRGWEAVKTRRDQQPRPQVQALDVENHSQQCWCGPSHFAMNQV